MRLCLKGRDFEELLISGAQSLISTMTDLEKVLEDKDGLLVGFDVKAADCEELFLKWMREIHFSFSAKRYVLADLKFNHLTERSFEARARAVVFDPDICGLRQNVKAVDSVVLKPYKDGRGWRAEVLLDV